MSWVVKPASTTALRLSYSDCLLQVFSPAVSRGGNGGAAIWGDEGSSLLLSQYSLAGIWVHAAHDVHPPLYFLLLHGWVGWFGDGVFSIRSLSVTGSSPATCSGISVMSFTTAPTPNRCCYNPPLPNGASSRPNAYGFGTLVAQDTYLDSLATLPKGTGRVWLVGTVDVPDEFAPLPEGWQRVGETQAGGANARLFVLH